MGNKILEAARCAHYFHEGQVRNTNDEPYYFHCARVAAIASSFADSTEEMVIAAWLHDTLEDTRLTMSELSERFGQAVCGYVQDLTNKYTKSVYPELNRIQRKNLEFQRLGNCSNEVKFLKLCDRLDNVSDIESLKQKKYYIEETYLLLSQIGDVCAYLTNEILSKLEEAENEIT